MKLALGTVQFGSIYGVSNTSGQVPTIEVAGILSRARSFGIDMLDTAAAYGDSEAVLGEVGAEGFRVISKIPPFPNCRTDMACWVEGIVENSITKLKVQFLDGILMHRPLELLEPGGRDAYDEMLRLKECGLVKKIGVSISQPKDLDLLMEYFDFDIVQAPMNLFDRRLETSGWLRKLNSQGVEVHIRSIFLQGLLLMPADDRPAYFTPWRTLFDQLDLWLNNNHLTALQGCLGYIQQFSEVSRFIVGVDSLAHLNEVSEAAAGVLEHVPDSFSSDDLKLINPALWRL
jgi:aryl-alcohol dehydrogenase-like predicted oxidoreductase